MRLFNKSKTVQLHNKEYDYAFIRSFKLSMENQFNAVFEEPETIGPVGSQVITTIPFKIDGNRMRLTIETYMGITLTGPRNKVDEIISILNTQAE